MKISAVPYLDDDPLDPADPFGRIVFEDDDGKELSVGSVFFDEWLGGLHAGLTAILDGQAKIQIDLDSEQDPLVWSYDGQAIAITHLKETMHIRDVNAFKDELRRSVIESADHYRLHPNWPKCTRFRKLLSWAEAGSDAKR
jgi:hypothetical protein